MLWVLFLLENVGFALHLVAALTLFAIAWLYIDAYVGSRPRAGSTFGARGHRVYLFLVGGFLLLAGSFVLEAVVVEGSVFGQRVELSMSHELGLMLSRLLGYGLVILGLALEKLDKRPEVGAAAGERKPVAKSMVVGLVPVGGVRALALLYPLLAGVVGLLYARQATTGMEAHLRRAAVGFGVLSVFELLSLGRLLRVVSEVWLWKLAAPFGPLWVAEHVVLGVAVWLIGRWAWRYLLRRLQSQLLILFVGIVLSVFLVTTVTFTGVLLDTVRQETLRRVTTDVRVLHVAVESMQKEVLATTRALAVHPEVVTGAESRSTDGLGELAEDFMVAEERDFLWVVAADGRVLARGEDRERAGDSLSEHPLVIAGLRGEAVSSVLSVAGVVAPRVLVAAVAPVRSADETVVGVVVAGARLDTAFVEGVKKTTGLEAAVYAETVLAASTATEPGVAIEDVAVRQTVLVHGEEFAGSVTVLQTPYLGAWRPLKDVDGVPVGMLWVGQPEQHVLSGAARSIQVTFVVTAGLLVLSIGPAFGAARLLAAQVR